ncbi:MAG: peptidoglycan domain protein [Muribaculaceae bacterium]|nr:peptidoglycan domain protein [Muribaculaceae bacterium]
MAHLEKIIPFLIFWETGVRSTSSETETLFNMAKAKGLANNPGDIGGLTLVGVTIGTYRDYCRRKGRAVSSVSGLSGLSYAEWLDILKTMFWDRWQADKITDQRVAHMLVDWIWMSGSYGITIPQKLLGVRADGVVGPKTLAAVNSRDPSSLSELLKRERIAYIDRICSSRPINRRFRSGWLRRINAL